MFEILNFFSGHTGYVLLIIRISSRIKAAYSILAIHHQNIFVFATGEIFVSGVWSWIDLYLAKLSNQPSENFPSLLKIRKHIITCARGAEEHDVTILGEPIGTINRLGH